MGDCGSQFLGFCVAGIGILLIERANTAVSPLVPILVLALPITDTLCVMARRIASGGSPDVLVVSIVVVAPNLPSVATLGLRATILETLMLFYGCELAFAEPAAQRPLLIAILISLSLLAFRALN